MTGITLSPAAAALWRFSLAVYGRPGVPAACLGLQDAHGVDVNVLLYCCWMAHRGWPLSPAQCRAAMKLTEAWRRDVVWPLRTIRRHVGTLDRASPSIASAYESLKACELRLEQQQQAMLADAAPGGPPQAANVVEALETFAAAMDIANAPGVEDQLAVIAAAVDAA